MKPKTFISLTLFLFVFSCSITQRNKEAKIAEQRPPVKCIENSPEWRGEEGCTILANRSLQETLTKDLYWHIDRFDSLEAAMNAAGVLMPESMTPIHMHSFCMPPHIPPAMTWKTFRLWLRVSSESILLEAKQHTTVVNLRAI
jgi:hypothetical protein